MARIKDMATNRGENPSDFRMSSSPSRLQKCKPTWRWPAGLGCSQVTRSVCTEIRSPGPEGEEEVLVSVSRRGTTDAGRASASRCSSGSSSAIPGRDSWPVSASWSFVASASQRSGGAGERSPSEQMTFWRGPLSVRMDSTRR